MSAMWPADPVHALHCRAGAGEPCTCRVRVRLSTAEMIDLISPDPELEQNAEAS